MPASSNVGKLLKMYRKNCLLTQQQVADALNINRTTYTYYEIGKTEPSIDTLHKLVKIFNITYEDLLPSESNPETVKDAFLVSKNGEAIYNLSPDEKEFVVKYRAMSDKEKKKVTVYMDKLRDGK